MQGVVQPGVYVVSIVTDNARKFIIRAIEESLTNGLGKQPTTAHLTIVVDASLHSLKRSGMRSGINLKTAIRALEMACDQLTTEKSHG